MRLTVPGAGGAVVTIIVRLAHGTLAAAFTAGAPLVDGRIVLPEFAQAGAFPAAAGLGARLGLAEEVGKTRSDKSGDRLTMALETEAEGQFIRCQLKVGQLLQRDKSSEELAGFRGPIGPVTAARKLGVELRAALQPARA